MRSAVLHRHAWSSPCRSQPDRNAHILPCPRLMVWRITGAVTWSEIWMFHISLSPCAAKSANSFGITDTSRISWPRRSKPRAIFSSAGRPNTAKLSSRPSARSLNPKRIRQAVADRAEFTDRRVALRRPATHLAVEIGLMAAADDDVPVLGNDRVDDPDRLAWIQHPGRDVERHGVRRLGRDAMRELFRAYCRRRRFAKAQLLVEAGKDCLDADEHI